MSVALAGQVNDEDVRNAKGVLQLHRRRLYPDTLPGGVARCQECDQLWPCVPVELAAQVLGVALSATRSLDVIDVDVFAARAEEVLALLYDVVPALVDADRVASRLLSRDAPSDPADEPARRSVLTARAASAARSARWMVTALRELAAGRARWGLTDVSR